MEEIPAALITNDVDLAAAKYPLAEHAHAFVVERIPFPKPIGLAQNFEALLRIKVFLHSYLLFEQENQFGLPKTIGLSS